MSLNILKTMNTNEVDGFLSSKDLGKEASDGTQSSPEVGRPIQRKRGLRKNGAERRRARPADLVNELELCTKRMKCMSLQEDKDQGREKKEAAPASKIDDGYEGDCEA